MSRLLIVGCGSREHALAWKLCQSPHVETLYVAPGNAGTAALGENVPIAATDLDRLVCFVQERAVDLTVIGPEAPLALGLGDALWAAGRRVVGPSAAAARIESSKAFAKDLMRRAGVPTAAYATFHDATSALRYLASASFPLVIKADGLAAGKGVFICPDRAEAEDVIRALMVGRLYGAAGSLVVIEEALTGPEVSLIALVDGERVVPLPVAQDHKRLVDGDVGPNTGGMGAYAPVPFVTPEQRDALVRAMMVPIVHALAAMGTPYRGVLFAGLMLTPSGPRVLEFNCRFGDPEAQVILPLLDGDLLPWLEAVADGRLLEGEIPVLDRSAVGVVLAAPGYPEKPQVGEAVESPPPASFPVRRRGEKSALVFHAGTALDESGHVVTAGGRVFTVVGVGDTIDEAAERAYALPVHFAGMQYRRDIAWQARPPLNLQSTTTAPCYHLHDAMANFAAPAHATGGRE